jgi:glycosyltransferase involved in cell wall biosynthesis
VLDAKPGARLTVIGDGPNSERLSVLARDLGVNQSVKFFGVKKRSEVAKLLAKSDVFLLTSLFETFGVVAIEAQAMGLPVVSTPCGGVSDIIEQGVNGQLSSGFDVESYVSEILEVDKLLVSLDKAKLRDDTLLKYGPQVIAKSLTRIYEAALSDYATKMG